MSQKISSEVRDTEFDEAEDVYVKKVLGNKEFNAKVNGLIFSLKICILKISLRNKAN